MSLSINDFKVYMPARDFEQSKRFYTALAGKIADSREFDNIRIKPPEAVDGSLVLHVVDPSGVLLVFVGRSQSA